METNSRVKLAAIDSNAPEPWDLERARRATKKSPGSGGTGASDPVGSDPEVAEKKSRRRFSA